MKTTTTRVVLAIAVCLGGWFACAPDAQAFYPTGFFDSAGELIYPRWDFNYMDVNGDGDIADTIQSDEGVEFHFEGGANGFTASEKTKVIAGLEVWENVSTAYIAFRFGQDISDPLELDQGFDNIDFINCIAIQVPEDPNQIAIGSFVNNFVTWAAENVTITIGGVQVNVPKGQIVDSDMVFDGVRTRAREQDLGFGFTGLAVLGGGTNLGIGYSPWNNYDEAASQAAGVNIEKRVVNIRDASGQLQAVGVTPTMHDDWSHYDLGNGILADSFEDLAPDDIAAITFLYPRTGGNFFSLSQQARTTTRQGFPSAQIAGGHIMAWCDTDNNAASARVPFIDTLTGLYESESTFKGYFVLRNLFTQLESSGGLTFPATYTMSCAEFEPEIFDQSQYLYTGPGFGFDTLFPSQVFREGGNIFGLENVDQGTPLKFDLTRRQIVSVNSGKSLDVMLAGGKPMFGDQNETCPLNVTVAGLKTMHGPNALRGFRDSVLLNNAVGVAVMDAYYRASPAMAQFLLRHGRVLATARTFARFVEWVFVHPLDTSIGIAAFAALACALRVWKRSRAQVVAGMVLLGVVSGLAAPAGAQSLYKSIEDHVAVSHTIVTGTVTAFDSHWSADGMRIETDISIKIDDAVKGKANKGGLVHLTLPTGRASGLVRYCPQLPEFAEGEEVLLFLKDGKRYNLSVTGGVTGKYRIRTDEETGEKYVYPGSRANALRFKKAMDAIKAQKAAETGEEAPEQVDEAPKTVTVDDFKDYLKDIDQQQMKARK
ncbi:MAG: hypothetical protein GY851_29800 [bacterium]|nr:hypothetical protein [bacterium]